MLNCWRTIIVCLFLGICASPATHAMDGDPNNEVAPSKRTRRSSTPIPPLDSTMPQTVAETTQQRTASSAINSARVVIPSSETWAQQFRLAQLENTSERGIINRQLMTSFPPRSLFNVLTENGFPLADLHALVVNLNLLRFPDLRGPERILWVELASALISSMWPVGRCDFDTLFRTAITSFQNLPRFMLIAWGENVITLPSQRDQIRDLLLRHSDRITQATFTSARDHFRDTPLSLWRLASLLRGPCAFDMGTEAPSSVRHVRNLYFETMRTLDQNGAHQATIVLQWGHMRGFLDHTRDFPQNGLHATVFAQRIMLGSLSRHSLSDAVDGGPDPLMNLLLLLPQQAWPASIRDVVYSAIQRNQNQLPAPDTSTRARYLAILIPQSARTLYDVRDHWLMLATLYDRRYHEGAFEAENHFGDLNFPREAHYESYFAYAAFYRFFAGQLNHLISQASGVFEPPFYGPMAAPVAQQHQPAPNTTANQTNVITTTTVPPVNNAVAAIPGTTATAPHPNVQGRDL